MKFLKTIAPAALSELWEKVSGNIVPKDTSANVGIGTDSPTENLHVKGQASNYATVSIETASDSHGSEIVFADSTDADYGSITQFASSSGEGGRMRFRAGATETMNLRGGNVGIGQTNPAAAIDIADGHIVLDNGYGYQAYTAAGVRRNVVSTDANENIIIGGTGWTDTQLASSGAITAPYQPAFLVQPSATQSNITTGSSVTVVFGTEIFDQGGDFASNTFTAPVSGRYQLNYAIELENVDTAATYYYIVLKTSNRDYNVNLTPGFSSDLSYYSMTYSVLADMDASDTAYVQIAQSGGTAQTDINANSKFSGFLAC